MATLTEVLSDPEKKEAVVADGVELIEQEVASKSGFTGMALKAGYKAFTRIKPGIARSALNMLLPDFAPAIDPHYEKAAASGDVGAYFQQHGDEIAEALLGVTDQKAQDAKNRLMVKLYKGLRGQAKGHVVAALPRLGALIEKHV